MVSLHVHVHAMLGRVGTTLGEVHEGAAHDGLIDGDFLLPPPRLRLERRGLDVGKLTAVQVHEVVSDLKERRDADRLLEIVQLVDEGRNRRHVVRGRAAGVVVHPVDFPDRRVVVSEMNTAA